MDSDLLLILLATSVAVPIYAYAGYPLLLLMVARRRTAAPPGSKSGRGYRPSVSILIAVHNEEQQMRELIDSLRSLDYPPAKTQILIVSDASTDRSDEIVSGYAGAGVELLRLSERSGKTVAETAAADRLTGEIIVHTDASTRISPGSLRELVAVFVDPTVGCASGQDVSVGSLENIETACEGHYVRYEMAIRHLETKVGGIVGASGCFFATRSALHLGSALKPSHSRDFASALHARQQGYRSVSVPAARAYVLRTSSLREEYRRRVRTATRGIETLWDTRRLLNPFEYGGFAWMLLSHKVLRWCVPWCLLTSIAVSTALLAGTAGAEVLLLGTAIACLAGGMGWVSALRGQIPAPLAIPAHALICQFAAAHALVRFLSGDRNATWRPTCRAVLPSDAFRGSSTS